MTISTWSIAKVCHEANRAYCQQIGDDSQVPWDEAPDWQKMSAYIGVVLHLGNPLLGPEASHESWMAEKVATGWSFGPVKDPEKKEHPCMVPFDDLPPSQQAKDHLFRAIVHALAPFNVVEFMGIDSARADGAVAPVVG